MTGKPNVVEATQHAAENLGDHLATALEEIKPRLRGWLHAVTAPLTLAAGIVLIALSPTAATRVGSVIFMLTSLLLFSGGSQFAFYGVIGTGGNPLAAVATASLLGLRNGFYGLQLSRVLAPSGRLRPVTAHLTIDESTAVALAQETRRGSRIGFYVTGVALFVVWNTTTLLGALAGTAMGDPRAYGLDAAAAAAFVALVWPRLFGRGEDGRTGPVATAALAMLLTLVAAPFTPTGVEVLVGATAALVVGLRVRRAPGEEVR